MYVWCKEKKTIFLYNEKKNFLWESTYKKTDWETTLLGHHMELRWRLKVFWSIGFEFHCIKVHFLFFVLGFKVTCYLSWMKQIRVCYFCCVFCMRCKTKFTNKIHPLIHLPKKKPKIYMWWKFGFFNFYTQ